LHHAVESSQEAVVFALDKIKQSWYVFGGVDGRQIAPREAVKKDEIRSAEIVLAQKLDTLLTNLDGINNEVVKRGTSGGDGDVELLVDCAQVAQSSVEAINAS
jgi:hypothetical protein